MPYWKFQDFETTLKVNLNGEVPCSWKQYNQWTSNKRGRTGCIYYTGSYRQNNNGSPVDFNSDPLTSNLLGRPTHQQWSCPETQKLFQILSAWNRLH